MAVVRAAVRGEVNLKRYFEVMSPLSIITASSRGWCATSLAKSGSTAACLRGLALLAQQGLTARLKAIHPPARIRAGRDDLILPAAEA
jgi:hypothetical protein